MMGNVFEEIDGGLAQFLRSQHVFFVATAPTSTAELVNVSPKGLDGSFAVLGPREVAYLDLTGSGAETIAHLRDNGRICLMFCAFDGPPRIVRLHGTGSVLLPGEEGFDALLAAFDPPEHALRSLILIVVERISDSCGYGVPLMRFDGRRSQYDDWVDSKVRTTGLDAYVAAKNAESIDGLPAIDR